MKAYAVVRKPKSTNNSVQYMVKLQKRDPRITIDSIEDNNNLSPRRIDGNSSSHLLERKSLHFRIDDTNVTINRSSRSPGKRYPIFDRSTSKNTKQKILDDSKFNSGYRNSQPIKEIAAFPLRDSIVSVKSSVNSNAKLNSSIKQIAQTPERNKQIAQRTTPYDMLNQTFGDRETISMSIPHKNKIFGEYRNSRSKSRQNKPNTFLYNQLNRTSYQIRPPSHVQSNKNKPVEVNDSFPMAPLQNAMKQVLLQSKNRKPQKDNINLDYSDSEINIGCCGDQSQIKKSKPYQLNGTSYTNNNNNFTDRAIPDSYPNRVIFNGITSAFASPPPPTYNRQQIPQQSILNLFNPESIPQKNEYKQGKISSKPLFNQQNQSQKKGKQTKVAVYQLASLSPFEF